MSNIATLEQDDFLKHMSQVFGWQREGMSYPYIKFKENSIVFVTEDDDGKKEEVKTSFVGRVIYMTSQYDLTEWAPEFRKLGSSNEVVGSSKFLWFDNEGQRYNGPFFGKQDLSAFIGNIGPNQKLDYKNVVYFLVEWKVYRCYLKRTQTVGMDLSSKDARGFNFKDPLKDGLHKLVEEKGNKLMDFEFEVTAGSYKKPPMTITYPSFKGIKEEKDDLLPTIQSIYNTIRKETESKINAFEWDTESITVKEEAEATVVEQPKVAAKKVDDWDLPF